MTLPSGVSGHPTVPRQRLVPRVVQTAVLCCADFCEGEPWPTPPSFNDAGHLQSPLQPPRQRLNGGATFLSSFLTSLFWLATVRFFCIMFVLDFRYDGHWPAFWASSPDNGRASTLTQSAFNRPFVTPANRSNRPLAANTARMKLQAKQILTDQTQGSVAHSRPVFSLFMNFMRYAATPSSPGLTVWEAPPYKRNGTEK